MNARTEREALEDAFDRADGEQEIAFRNHQRAKAKNVGVLMRASLEHAKRAHRELVRLAAKLSTKGMRR
jgi:hypothetical protein